MKKLLNIFLPLLVLAMIMSCKKFLEEKPNSNLSLANSVKDYQALMDRYTIINFYDVSSGEASAGETYITDADFNNREQEDQRLYTWENSLVYASQVNDWSYTYKNIYYANSVIEGLPTVERNGLNAADWDSVLGQGYFIRARNFLQALGTWCVAYKPGLNDADLGIPLRVNTDFNAVSERENLQHCYEQVISDLKHAIVLLPKQPVHIMRASKPAAYALLARTYLWIADYKNAGLYADSCLQLKNSLLDYNTLNASAIYPIAQFNIEVLFSSKLNNSTTLSASRSKIISELYGMYEPKDLRKTIYFSGNGSYAFKGSYDGSITGFSGMAVDEVYLTRAECLARQGKVSAALADINFLLVTRYLKGSAPSYNITDEKVALQLILRERRKQLLYRGIRWMDIKRLNLEGAGISLSRTVNGKTFVLPANSKRFAIPIPEEVISQSLVVQNQY